MDKVTSDVSPPNRERLISAIKIHDFGFLLYHYLIGCEAFYQFSSGP